MSGDYLCSFGIIVLGLWWANRQIVARREDFGPSMRGWAAVGFLVTGATFFLRSNPSNGGEWLEVGIISATGSQLIALAAAIVLPVVRVFRNGWTSWRADVRQAAKQQEDAERAERDRVEQQLAWERGEPERVRQAEAAAEHQKQVDAQKRLMAADQRRRESLRSDCLLYYHLHAPEFHKRFSRAKYDAYVAAYLRDDMPMADVEKQAAKLMALMHGHLEMVGDDHKRMDIVGLARWYEEQKATIEAANMPELSKETALNTLYERYEELMQKHMETMRP